MFNKKDKELFIDLLGKMLEFNYKKRINIKEAINHPFLRN
jgi:serine/threonine protein kinase